jgi:branched-chain amino acid transport system substrate-binding protein
VRLLLRAVLAVFVVLLSMGAITETVGDRSISDVEFRIGSVMLYSGAFKPFDQIGKAEAAYFEIINERGGIGGRRIRFVSCDHRSDAASFATIRPRSPASGSPLSTTAK